MDYAFSLHETSHKGGPGVLIEAAEALAKLDAPDRNMALETLALLYRDLAVIVTDAPRSLLAMRFAAERVGFVGTGRQPRSAGGASRARPGRTCGRGTRRECFR